MGVLFDYFRAGTADAVRKTMDEQDGGSPLGVYDGADLKGIEPAVTLGQVVGFALGREWSVGLVAESLIWPEDAREDIEYEGPWVSVLDDGSRDALAAIPADDIPELAERWARIEEFHGNADIAYLREVLTDVSALAVRAREHDESLYVWSSL